MSAVNWLILLAAIVGLLILIDGYRRTRRTDMSYDRPADITEPPQAEHDAWAEKGSSDEEDTMQTIAVSEASKPLPPSSETASSETAIHPSRERNTNDRSVIGATLHVRGRIEANEPLTVAGRVDGEIHARHHCVTLLSEGYIGPSIRSRRLIAAGTLSGNVMTDECVTFHSGASFKGTLDTARLECGEGVQLTGRFHVGKTPEGKPASRRSTKARK